MEINFTEDEIKLLLGTLGVAHQIEFFKGNDNSHLEKLIAIIHHALKQANKVHIFTSVFEEYKE